MIDRIIKSEELYHLAYPAAEGDPADPVKPLLNTLGLDEKALVNFSKEALIELLIDNLLYVHH